MANISLPYSQMIPVAIATLCYLTYKNVNLLKIRSESVKSALNSILNNLKWQRNSPLSSNVV